MQSIESLRNDPGPVIRLSSASVISSVEVPCWRSHWGSCFLKGNLSWLRDCFVFISSGCLLARQAQDGARYFFEYKKCICPKFQSDWEHEESGNSIKKKDQTANRVVTFLEKYEKWFCLNLTIRYRSICSVNLRETWEKLQIYLTCLIWRDFIVLMLFPIRLDNYF